MPELDELLKNTADSFAWRPQTFCLTDECDRELLKEWFKKGYVASVVDTIEAQLDELICLRHVARKLSKSDILAHTREHRGDVALVDYGAWAYYPWSKKLVHVLPKDEFLEVRHARNCYKIKPDEQASLGNRLIGVVGLSVGQASAVTLAQEGVGRAFRLADFDHSL